LNAGGVPDITAARIHALPAVYKAAAELSGPGAATVWAVRILV